MSISQSATLDRDAASGGSVKLSLRSSETQRRANSLSFSVMMSV